MELDKPRECEECKLRNGSGVPFRRSQDSDLSLRSEVASLRDEVATLKEALTAQMQVFSDERKKWERDVSHSHLYSKNERIVPNPAKCQSGGIDSSDGNKS
ncbi:hypothetical protein OESDEN_19118 [Oesophagostomum dentatum]|uniref:Uncharacterized protein n=1 Tax=Oesophagostomum dentatum TaxID=61180 RepID=A0A0B1SBF3_OESDE|nr:hypothetical protein OESDEN_19118 [Oesophagostomum dentatum]